MEKLLGPLWDFVKDRLSVQEVLLVIVCALAVYAWHQFHRTRNLTEFNEQERRRAQLAIEDLARLRAESKPIAEPTDRRRGDDSADRRQRCTSRVLVVEDNEVMQTIIPAMLAKCLSSVEVKVRESAQGALEELETFNPELLVLDLRLKAQKADWH
ncbi:MAG: response regulator [Burkholderiales bacterium]|nr:response regulator [Burkholderiales bacterium]